MTSLLRSEAIGWIEDCFDDVPENLTDLEIQKAVHRHYSGGWYQFVADSA
jgi:hypothetical protein